MNADVIALAYIGLVIFVAWCAIKNGKAGDDNFKDRDGF